MYVRLLLDARIKGFPILVEAYGGFNDIYLLVNGSPSRAVVVVLDQCKNKHFRFEYSH